MRILFIIIIFAFLLTPLKASEVFLSSDSLEIVQIRNDKLMLVLDSILMYEKQCVYYTPELLFSIRSQNYNDTVTVLQIEAFGTLKLKNDRDKGCFEYGGHLFFVKGNGYNAIFKGTNKKKHIDYYIKEKNVIYPFEDDSHAIWIYCLYKNEFIFVKLWENSCKCK
jgi:hypothetical protein